MLRNRYLKILKAAASLLLAVLLVAWGRADAAPTGSVTYKDKLGRTVVVPLPVRRAVLLISYDLVPVLGLWDRVVGVARWAYDNDVVQQSNPDIRSIPSVGSGTDVNMEALLKLKPDLVLTWTFKADLARYMEERGLRVIAIYPESLPELYDVMRLCGRLFEREARMERAIGEMEVMFRMVRERVAGIPEGQRKKVLYIGSKPTVVSGATGVTNDMITLIGARNPASVFKQRNIDVPIERIVEWNPDVIIIWGNARYMPSDLTNDPKWRLIPAVRNGQVYKAPEWNTWSPRLAPYVLWMAEKTYPERFRDVAMDKVIGDFHMKVYGVPGKAWQ